MLVEVAVDPRDNRSSRMTEQRGDFIQRQAGFEAIGRKGVAVGVRDDTGFELEVLPQPPDPLAYRVLLPGLPFVVMSEAYAASATAETLVAALARVWDTAHP